MPQLSMSLWLAAVQITLVPVTEAIVLQKPITDNSQTNQALTIKPSNIRQTAFTGAAVIQAVSELSQ
ncbi:MAG: hypothetical protein AAGC54_17825 [Cyanobacteria bacterium P01_F01_bin.4]